jgi:hypothetical protein
VNRSTGRNVVGFQCLVVRKLFARVNESNLIDLNALFLLQRLLDCQYLVLGFKAKSLLASSEGLDKDLESARESGKGEANRSAQTSEATNALPPKLSDTLHSSDNTTRSPPFLMLSVTQSA